MRLEVRDGHRTVSLDFGVSEFQAVGVGGFVRGMFLGSSVEEVIREADGRGVRYVLGRKQPGGCGSLSVAEGKCLAVDTEGVPIVCDDGSGVGSSQVPLVGGGNSQVFGGDASFYGGSSGEFSTGSLGVGKKKSGKRVNHRAKKKNGSSKNIVGGALESSDWRNVSREEKDDRVVGDHDKTEAQLTLEQKWAVLNRVEIAKAKVAEQKAIKDLEFQKARDVDAEVRRSRAQVMRKTEQCKVATEKAFSYLRSTGNVPGCVTVLSDDGVPELSDGASPVCTISPDSSASMHEFREVQKKNLDLEEALKKSELMVARLKRSAKLSGATVMHEVALTTDGEEPTPSLQEEMDEMTAKYGGDFVCEPAFRDGRNVLLVKKDSFGYAIDDYEVGGDSY